MKNGYGLPRSPRIRSGAKGWGCNDKGGFTFIELLVVISIIGIVFAAGIVSYSAITIRSRDTRRKADLESIRQSLEICRSLTGSYPASIYDEVSCGASGPVLLAKTPLDPKPCVNFLDGEYTYVLNVSANTFTLTADCTEDGAAYVVTNP